MQNKISKILDGVDGGLKELLRPQELPEGASRMDVKTIKNAIKKRIPGSTEECIVLMPFQDAIGIGISIELMGRMFEFSEPARIGFNHKDLLNVLDRFETAIKKKKCEIGLQSSGFILPEDILKY